MLVIGLTGGIGTGKSTASEVLERLGSYVLNADLVGHETQAPHTPAWRDLIETFGADILQEPDGPIDRRKLGGIVFSDPEALQKLNAIMHPRMYDVIEARLVDLKEAGHKVVVLEAAILIEGNWIPLVDKIWVTIAPEKAVVQRLQERNALTEEQVVSRIRSQMASEERLSYADVIIDTDCPLEDVDGRVREAWEREVVQAGWL